MDTDFLVHSLGGSAIIAAVLTLARLLLDYGFRRGERRVEHDNRRRAEQHDAEARLERILQDRLADADRRLERCLLDVQAERGRTAALEQEHVRLAAAHQVLKQQYAALQTEHARLLRKQRLATTSH